MIAITDFQPINGVQNSGNLAIHAAERRGLASATL